MSNGHLRTRVIEIIEGDKATQKERLDLLLQIVLDVDDKLEAVESTVNSNPIAWIPERWRKRATLGFGVWMSWVSLNVAGVPLGIDAIWKFITKLT